MFRAPLFLLALSLAAPAFAQDVAEEPAPAPMQAAPMEEAPAAMTATMATATEEPATMATMATMATPMTTAAQEAEALAARRERMREAREAREAAAAEAAAAEAAAAEAAAEPAPVVMPTDPTLDEVGLEASEEELEAIAEEENLDGEDFADEEPFDPATLLQEDESLLDRIEETDFEDAHAAMHGEAEHGTEVTASAIFSSRQFLASVITFGVLLFIFWWFLFRKGKAVPTALESRRREIEEHLAEAQRLKAEAEAKKAEYTERLEALDGQLETLRAEMVRAGEVERDRIVSEAESKAAAIRKDVEFTIQQRMKQLRDELTQEMAAAAVAAAEEVLRAETKPADHQRLADAYLKNLAGAAAEDTTTTNEETQA